MLGVIFGYTVALLVLNLAGNGVLTPIVEYDKGLRYEEYIVEHEISAGQAKNAALTIDLNSVTSPAGCQKCSKDEIKYCLGRDLIGDHCCCDKRYHEVLPFIPHTCYFGTQICKPVAEDCEKYNRLRRCCCDRHVLQKSVYTSNNIEPLDAPVGLASYPPYAETFRRRCPLCDSSVYSYCSDKLFHDSCCCHNPNNPYDRLPYQCKFADCSFLHANSCQEHKLITACCCTSIYFKK
ncbi:hypothetical protein BDFB_004812 [Asbolus verrucosus]|uniref:CCC domain-containing protein n=1 Tax=Asbolus verrucosus TaxID=1661398 RepID=A0A482VBA5_ASBVE|nr:hypothetical protein BDFB_004812 [Asbolus verrucosus]